MLQLYLDIFTFVLVMAVLIVVVTLAHKSQARVWRLLGWFACVFALTLFMVEGYGWYRRGDWQVTDAYRLWRDINRDSLLWLGNIMPRVIWGPVEFVLHFPAWLVMTAIGIALLAFDHRQLQKSRIGEKPPTLRKRLKEWLRKLQRDEEEEADKA